MVGTAVGKRGAVLLGEQEKKGLVLLERPDLGIY